jgi:hypothetical protein
MSASVRNPNPSRVSAPTPSCPNDGKVIYGCLNRPLSL